MSNCDSKENLLEHSRVKLKLLKYYLERYLNILNMSKYVKNVHLFDLFCGSGLYKDGGEGSPIVMLKCIKEICSKRDVEMTRNFNCLFNDHDKSKLDILKKYIENQKLDKINKVQISYSNEDYQYILPGIISKINSLSGEKAFVFIDPFGYRNIKVADILKLLQSGNSEVLLFLPTHFMFRFHSKGTPESLLSFISEILPSDKWTVGLTGLKFIENLKQAFRDKMSKDFFVDSFVIERRKNQFFCLFFFTHNLLGFEKMLEAKWKLDEFEGRVWCLRQDESNFLNFENIIYIDGFDNDLMEFIKEERTNSEIYEFTLHQGHLPKHTNKVLSKLQKEGRLSVKSIDEKPIKKSCFYINYSNYKKGKTVVICLTKG